MDTDGSLSSAEVDIFFVDLTSLPQATSLLIYEDSGLPLVIVVDGSRVQCVTVLGYTPSHDML